MERERLTSLLEAPSHVTRADLPGLRELAGRHPWFAGAQLLRALGEQASGEVLVDDGLRTAAAHLPTRSILFDAMHASGVAGPGAPAVSLERPSTGVPSDTAIDMADPGRREDSSEDRPETGTPVPDAVPGVTSGAEATPEASLVDPASPEDQLDMEMRRAAMSSSYALLLEHAKKAPLGSAVPAALEATVPPAEEGTRQEEPATMSNGPFGPRQAAHSAIGRRRFTDWLADTGPGEGAGAVPPGDLEKPQALATAKAVDQLGSMAAEMAAQQGAQSLDAGTLIDRFIQQQAPQPTAQKAEFFTPQQAGKRSLQDTSDLVTETLARIYAQQGNLAKAREAYRRLALKYPEKSAYFAALSKKAEDRDPN